jgi:hypothetical protein
LDDEKKAIKGVILCNDDEGTEKFIPCRQVITSQQAISQSESSPDTKSILRRISIVQGTVVPDSVQQRHVILFPPESIGNTCAIHGLILDWHVRVAAPTCSVLHLSTVLEDGEDVNVLERAAGSLFEDAASTGEEIFNVTFSYPLRPGGDGEQTPGIEGMHVCSSGRGPSLVADYHFAEAKSIFEQICPDVDFLALSTEMDATIREYQVAVKDAEEDDDDERMVLDSAMSMIEKKTSGSDAKTEQDKQVENEIT